MNGTNRRRAIVVLAASVATAAGARWAQPTVHIADNGPKVDLGAWFPSDFGGWRIATDMPVIIPSPDTQAQLDKIYNQTLSRTYIDTAGNRLMLCVAYGGDQSDGTRAHRPEVCYPAQGFSISYNGVNELPVAAGSSLRVRRLMSAMGSRKEPITYWVIVGDQVVLTGFEQKLAQLRYGFRGLIPDGLLIRISTIDPDPARGWAVQERFVKDLHAALSPALQARLLGTSLARA